jgi:hypothetical protein
VREKARLPQHRAPAAGSPLKRQRKAAVRGADGGVIAFSRLTHPRAGLSDAQWRALSPDEKVERLLNMPLDRAAAILTWPVGELGRDSLWMQVWHVVFMMGVKGMLEGKLGRDRDRGRALEALSPELRARLRDGAVREA